MLAHPARAWDGRAGDAGREHGARWMLLVAAARRPRSPLFARGHAPRTWACAVPPTRRRSRRSRSSGATPAIGRRPLLAPADRRHVVSGRRISETLALTRAPSTRIAARSWSCHGKGNKHREVDGPMGMGLPPYAAQMHLTATGRMVCGRLRGAVRVSTGSRVSGGPGPGRRCARVRDPTCSQA